MLARVKLKGIDGGSHKRWSMLFNSRYAKDLTWVRNVGINPVKAGGLLFGV